MMVVFMVLAAQLKSIRLPFVMLFAIPVSLTGIVMARSRVHKSAARAS